MWFTGFCLPLPTFVNHLILNAMKKVFISLTNFVFVALAMQCFTSCAQEEPDTAPLNVLITPPDTMATVTITFACGGDFQMQPFTRSLEADGKAMTDLWVMDYADGSLAQQIHQTSSDTDFGSPTLNLAVGCHHVYFIASRGEGATIDTDAHTITFSKVRDTFYMDYEINVTATSSGNRSVTLERCVNKLTMIFSDAIPDGAATINMTPATWYYALDYLTGEPATPTASQTITINIPASNIGMSNVVASIFGFSSAAEWQTDIAINCKKSDGTTLGYATLTDVPLKCNRVTSYTGPLFSSNGQTTVALSTTWDTPTEGTW